MHCVKRNTMSTTEQRNLWAMLVVTGNRGWLLAHTVGAWTEKVPQVAHAGCCAGERDEECAPLRVGAAASMQPVAGEIGAPPACASLHGLLAEVEEKIMLRR